MKPVTEILAKTTGQSSSKTSDSYRARPSRRMQELFSRMAVIYGNTWTSQFRNEQMTQLALSTWSRGLEEYTDEQIERGVENLTGSFPPSLPEFKKLCLTIRKHKSHEIYKALPVPKADKATAMKHIAKMREAMRDRT